MRDYLAAIFGVLGLWTASANAFEYPGVRIKAFMPLLPHTVMGSSDRLPREFPTDIARKKPASRLADRSVSIEQVGDSNRTVVRQLEAGAFAHVNQAGKDNQLLLEQSGEESNSTHVAAIAQQGESNAASVAQSGDGYNEAQVTQFGAGNALFIRQHSNSNSDNIGNAVQSGSQNRLSLIQNDGSNEANLAQYGDGNSMTATQEGFGNSLNWTQTGNYLSDLKITQSGNAAMIITQSR